MNTYAWRGLRHMQASHTHAQYCATHLLSVPVPQVTEHSPQGPNASLYRPQGPLLQERRCRGGGLRPAPRHALLGTRTSEAAPVPLGHVSVCRWTQTGCSTCRGWGQGGMLLEHLHNNKAEGWQDRRSLAHSVS
jgi:hypothetical protein